MRLLIVEDEAPLRNGLLKLLREEGYAADGAANGEEGLHKAMETDYDAIVLDYLMPVMDGREMLRRLRHTKRTPVMMLTARNSVDDRVTGLDLGAVGVAIAIGVGVARIGAEARLLHVGQAVAVGVEVGGVDDAVAIGVARGVIG
jgi:CheY-like chemotaxis protein